MQVATQIASDVQILVFAAKDPPLVAGRTGRLARGGRSWRETVRQPRTDRIILHNSVVEDGEQDAIAVEHAHLDSDLDHLAFCHRIPVRCASGESVPEVL